MNRATKTIVSTIGVILGISDLILVIDLVFVFGGGLGMFLISFVCGFSADIQAQAAQA